MVYYKVQYNQDQFSPKDMWIDLNSFPLNSAEEAYKQLLHFSLKTDSYIRCRIVKVTEEQVYFDQRFDKEIINYDYEDL